MRIVMVPVHSSNRDTQASKDIDFVSLIFDKNFEPILSLD